jgi:hypothetical protein
VNVVSFQVMTDDARELAREYVSKPNTPLPDDIFHWAVNHSDRVIQEAAGDILHSLPLVMVRYDKDAPDLSLTQKVAFFERRLRQAVREGNSKATPFPPLFWYGTYDLQQGAYARLADGFAILRDRLLATRRIDADDLADLPLGCAAAKLEQDDGRMRQCLLRFPLAITPEHSYIVKTLFDRDGPLPETWPSELDPTFVEAGQRARRIRERNRRRYLRPVVPAPASDGPGAPPVKKAPRAGAVPTRTSLPVQAEVDID